MCNSTAIRIAVFVCLFALAGCDPDSVVEVGAVHFDGPPPRVGVPASGKRNEPVRIDVVTSGGGCVTKEYTDVTVTMSGAEITPYDRQQLDGPCKLDLMYLRHDVSVQFDTSGPKIIRINSNSKHVDFPMLIE